jgi:hypothetical protein
MYRKEKWSLLSATLAFTFYLNEIPALLLYVQKGKEKWSLQFLPCMHLIELMDTSS